MVDQNHKSGTVPEGAKLWRVGWLIEAADGDGVLLKGDDSLRWGMCTVSKGGEKMMMKAGEEIGVSLLRNIAALLAQGDFQELDGTDESGLDGDVDIGGLDH